MRLHFSQLDTLIFTIGCLTADIQGYLGEPPNRDFGSNFDLESKMRGDLQNLCSFSLFLSFCKRSQRRCVQLLFANPFHLASFLAALHELDKVTMSVVSLDFDYDDVLLFICFTFLYFQKGRTF